jgi:hypothetical protein
MDLRVLAAKDQDNVGMTSGQSNYPQDGEEPELDPRGGAIQ